MLFLRFAFSPSGRVARRDFAIAVLCVYLASFLSQILLAAPVTARVGPWLFLAMQAMLLWVWFCLHARRLRDAGRGIETAGGIALLYALAMVLLVLVAVAAPDPDQPGGARGAIAGIIQLFAVLALFGQIFGDPQMSGFGFVLAGLAAIILVPIAVAVGFSIHTGLGARAA